LTSTILAILINDGTTRSTTSIVVLITKSRNGLRTKAFSGTGLLLVSLKYSVQEKGFFPLKSKEITRI
jgi:hypothetical protein